MTKFVVNHTAGLFLPGADGDACVAFVMGGMESGWRWEREGYPIPRRPARVHAPWTPRWHHGVPGARGPAPDRPPR